MFKKLYTGLMLVAGVAVVSVVIARIFEKDEFEEECDDDCEKACR